MTEGQTYDKKSLKLLTAKNPDWGELAKDCVAFANYKGGEIHIGIEDKEDLPPSGQKIGETLSGRIHKRMSELTVNTGVSVSIEVAPNGGEYINLKIYPSNNTIAGTVDGKYYIRMGDKSCPLLPDQLLRLSTDKPSYIWETKILRVPRNSYDPEKMADFMAEIKVSERVSQFVKSKTADELLDYYMMAEGENLTNLGVLWVGKRADRAKLSYSPVVQFIKYDEKGQKVNKIVWDDHSLNPKELIASVWRDIPDWKEGIEVANGIFRKFVPNYGERTIRELFTNAMVHRPYTTAGDIFINLYPDRMEMCNPGTFPLGVTPHNILRTTQRRNEQLCKVAYDLGLMEREGSGYDTIYEDLLSNGKPLPIPEELDDRVKVTVFKNAPRPETVSLIDRVNEEYQLSQKELIALGLIAQHQTLSATELTKLLDMQGSNPTRAWLERLLELGIINSHGKTKGTEYCVSPDIIKRVNFTKKTTLRSIEPYRLAELVYQDVKAYPGSTLTEILKRIGPEIPRHKAKAQLNKLIKECMVAQKGKNRWTTYSISIEEGA
jgi:ATP-dependent DNA helicase RecG